MDDEILYSVADGVGTITLNRPQARNALTFGMYERLAAICSRPAGHGAPKVLVFTGAGEKAFAAGTDISQFRAFSTPEDALGYEERIDRILTAIETCPIPTIAAISGAVTGGGASIACACDMRIATANARFGFPVARTLGNCLSMSSYARLVALLGAGAGQGRRLHRAAGRGARKACAPGSTTRSSPDHAALMQRAQALPTTIAGHAPLTMRATKQALHRLGPCRRRCRAGDDLVVMCYMSADFREGMEAFLGKRTTALAGALSTRYFRQAKGGKVLAMPAFIAATTMMLARSNSSALRGQTSPPCSVQPDDEKRRVIGQKASRSAPCGRGAPAPRSRPWCSARISARSSFWLPEAAPAPGRGGAIAAMNIRGAELA